VSSCGITLILNLLGTNQVIMKIRPGHFSLYESFTLNNRFSVLHNSYAHYTGFISS